MRVWLKRLLNKIKYKILLQSIRPTNNVLIGPLAGFLLTEGKRNIFIGYNAGRDLRNISNIVIIGDDIKDLTPDQPNRIYIKDNIIIGKLIFGKENPIYHQILAITNNTKEK